MASQGQSSWSSLTSVSSVNQESTSPRKQRGREAGSEQRTNKLKGFRWTSYQERQNITEDLGKKEKKRKIIWEKLSLTPAGFRRQGAIQAGSKFLNLPHHSQSQPAAQRHKPRTTTPKTYISITSINSIMSQLNSCFCDLSTFFTSISQIDYTTPHGYEVAEDE